MPYSPDHKRQTRARIVEAARMLFNRHGFDKVTIDQIMATAGLTRGGFYAHFRSKAELHAEAVASFLMGRGAEWRAQAGVDPAHPAPAMAAQMVESYLSDAHLGDLEGQCPMIALPSDIARADPATREAYQRLLEAMVGLFEQCMAEGTDIDAEAVRERALVAATLCVGGMVLARTLPQSSLVSELRRAALSKAVAITVA